MDILAHLIAGIAVCGIAIFVIIAGFGAMLFANIPFDDYPPRVERVAGTIGGLCLVVFSLFLFYIGYLILPFRISIQT